MSENALVHAGCQIILLKNWIFPLPRCSHNLAVIGRLDLLNEPVHRAQWERRDALAASAWQEVEDDLAPSGVVSKRRVVADPKLAKELEDLERQLRDWEWNVTLPVETVLRVRNIKVNPKKSGMHKVFLHIEKTQHPEFQDATRSERRFMIYARGFTSATVKVIQG